MFDTFAVPITVHCAIPITERKYPILKFMADSDDSDIDPALAANFSRLMAGRSVGALRQEMAEKGMTIGSGAIQAAKAGSRGLRLETLQKFAEFFDCEVYELIKPRDVQEVWPFGTAITPEQFRALDSAAVQAALDVLVSAAKRQAIMTKLGAPAPATDSRVGQFIQAAPPHELHSDFGELTTANLGRLKSSSEKKGLFNPAQPKPGKSRKEGGK